MGRLLGRSKRERRLRLASLLAIGAGCIYLVIAGIYSPLGRVQDAFNDSLFREQKGSPNIVMVTIGEGEFAQHGRLSTWPRTLHAQAIERLSDAGARVIVYDLLFADEGAEDAALAAAMRDAGNVVLAAAGSAELGEDDAGVMQYSDFAQPVPQLSESARAVAHSHLKTDDDGRVRRVPVVGGDGNGTTYPSLSLAAMALQFGRDPDPALVQGSDSFDLFGRTVPIEDSRSLRVNYAGGAAKFPQVPFSAVLDGSMADGAVRDRIVVVGVRATGVDRHSTPLLGDAAGMEIHVNALDTLLRARFLQPMPGWAGIVTALAMAGFASLAALRWRVRWVVPSGLAIAAGYLVFAAFMFTQGRLIDAVNPPATLMVAMAAGLSYRVASERAAQQEVIELFGRHVTGEVAQELVRRADMGELQLGGELREVTVLFGDVRGFTTLSGGMDPERLVQLLNERFEIVVSSVIENGGIVNKFIGDAIVAFWNAPQEREDHAMLACRAALSALDRLESMDPGDGPEIRLGFGVNTGIALAGNIGSAGRFEYTVMGDTVNIASRFSGASGAGEVWVGGRTMELLDGRIGADELPPQQLKGMVAPVAAFRLHRAELLLESISSRTPVEALS